MRSNKLEHFKFGVLTDVAIVISEMRVEVRNLWVEVCSEDIYFNSPVRIGMLSLDDTRSMVRNKLVTCMPYWSRKWRKKNDQRRNRQ